MRTRQTPPGPTGEPLFGNSRQYARDPFAFLDACADAYGDVVHFELGPMDTYMLTNPADVERVFVTDERLYRKPDFQDDALGELLGNGLLLSEGDDWRKQRDLANPAFNMGRIAGLAGRMVDRTEAAIADWTDGDRIDVQSEMARLTVAIIVETMFGRELPEARIRTVQEYLEPLGARFEPNPIRFVLPDWVPTRENRAYHEAIGVLEGVIEDVVADRRAAGDYRDESKTDLLSILLRAQDRGEQSGEQLRDEMMTMLLAGHDTTALSLTYTWYLLSQHPEAETRLHEELAAELGGRPPAFEDVRRLAYTERLLQEAMRLYPPVYVTFREPKVDVRLGGYRVPAGSAVLLPQWVLHRSPRYWKDPEAFDPDRFLPDRTRDRPRFAYFPFGGGPRHCIGKQFSMLEARVILATVAGRYRLAYDREEPFTLRGTLTMHPRESMTMRVHERE